MYFFLGIGVGAIVVYLLLFNKYMFGVLAPLVVLYSANRANIDINLFIVLPLALASLVVLWQWPSNNQWTLIQFGRLRFACLCAAIIAFTLSYALYLLGV